MLKLQETSLKRIKKTKNTMLANCPIRSNASFDLLTKSPNWTSDSRVETRIVSGANMLLLFSTPVTSVHLKQDFYEKEIEIERF